VRGVEKSLDTEALRVVKEMPRWTPGIQKGQKVRVNFNMPVSFKLK
jgi:outer membrane biosynthesis protein TonB